MPFFYWLAADLTRHHRVEQLCKIRVAIRINPILANAAQFIRSHGVRFHRSGYLEKASFANNSAVMQ